MEKDTLLGVYIYISDSSVGQKQNSELILHREIEKKKKKKNASIDRLFGQK